MKRIAIIVIILYFGGMAVVAAVNCIIEEQRKWAPDPTPTPAAFRAALPQPSNTHLPEICQETMRVHPDHYGKHYWAAVVQTEESEDPRVISVTSINDSATDHADIDWHNAAIRHLAPWGVNIPEDDGYEQAAALTKANHFAPGSFVRVLVDNDEDLIAIQRIDPVPSYLVNQYGMVWSWELLLNEAAQPDIDPEQLSEATLSCAEAIIGFQLNSTTN